MATQDKGSVHHLLASESDLRALEALRLDNLQLAHWDRAMDGDVEATMAVLDVMEARAQLFGLYQGTHEHDFKSERDDDLDGLPALMGLAEVLSMIECRLREFAAEQSG